jgi:serine/threonine protein kinase
MNRSVVIFLNDNAIDVKDLFLNKNWNISKLFDRIYSICVEGEKLQWLVKTYENKKYAKIESDNLNSLKKINGIPKVLATNISRSLSYIILSEAPGMDLFEYIDKYGVLSEKKIRVIAKQLLSIISSMHKKRIIHKDIKPENIIYDSETEAITLIDFEEKYTEDYRSPEQISKKDLTDKCDMWSTGITLYYLYTGDVPFRNEKAILYKTLVFPKGTSESFKDFLGCLIERNVSLRYSADEALNHFWIN